MYLRIHNAGIMLSAALLTLCFAVKGAGQQADEKPKNLQYFPKDTTLQALIQRCADSRSH